MINEVALNLAGLATAVGIVAVVGAVVGLFVIAFIDAYRLTRNK